MRKRKILLISSIICGALIVGGVLVLYNSGTKDANRLDKTVSDSTTAGTQALTEVDKKTEPASDEKDKIVKTEDVQVMNNTPEYDLMASVYQNEKGEVFLKLGYYSEGSGVTKELGADRIPELYDLFKKREGAVGINKGSWIQRIYFNPVKQKAYFFVEGIYNLGETDAKLYSFDLKNDAVKKLFEGLGNYGDIKFTQDNSYLAFNYTAGASSANPDLKMDFIEVIKCENDEFALNRSSDSKGVLMGGDKDVSLIYEYSFLFWTSNGTARVKETRYQKDKNGLSSGLKEQKELIYDISKNIFLNLDGSSVSTNTAASTGSAVKVKVDSEPVKTLRSYYNLMSTGQYAKANGLLDDKFKLRLNILKQFGIEELTKSDMDESNMALYSALFKSSSIDSIVYEKTAGSGSTIYFYLVYSLAENDTTKQPLIAMLNKTTKGWKIASVIEGSAKDSPFSKQ